MISYVYLIGIDDARPVKIGYAGNPWARMQSLQVGHPSQLELRAAYVGGRDLEQAVHARFSSFRVRGEWFDFGYTDPVAELSRFVTGYRATPATPAAVRPSPTQPGAQTAPAPSGGRQPVDQAERNALVLSVLHVQQGQSMSRIARKLGLAPASVKRTLQRLQGAGLVARCPDGLWAAASRSN